MNILITICARGGSKGIPGKNVKEVNGKPLIAYSIAAAQSFALAHTADIALSTDNEEIKEVAAAWGLITNYTRPAIHATDVAGKKGVILDVLEWEEQQRQKEYDFILDLDVTSPLRTQQDLKEGYRIIQEDEACQTLFSVNKAHRNPYFNMVERKPDGYYGLVKSPDQGVLTRQSAPPVYDLNASFYFYRRDFFRQDHSTVITEQSLVYVMPHPCFDLDEPLDFEILAYLLENQKLKFQI